MTSMELAIAASMVAAIVGGLGFYENRRIEKSIEVAIAGDIPFFMPLEDGRQMFKLTEDRVPHNLTLYCKNGNVDEMSDRLRRHADPEQLSPICDHIWAKVVNAAG